MIIDGTMIMGFPLLEKLPATCQRNNLQDLRISSRSETRRLFLFTEMFSTAVDLIPMPTSRFTLLAISPLLSIFSPLHLAQLLHYFRSLSLVCHHVGELQDLEEVLLGLGDGSHARVQFPLTLEVPLDHTHFCVAVFLLFRDLLVSLLLHADSLSCGVPLNECLRDVGFVDLV